MARFIVKWVIDIDADSAQEAAEIALAIQRKETSIAVVFEVKDDDGHTSMIDLIDESQP